MTADSGTNGKGPGTALLAPLDYEPCGANKKLGRGKCRNRPEVGRERCRFHKGRPIKHGLYSTLVKRSDRIAALMEEHAANPDPLDTTPELALTRALLQDWIERYSEIMPALLAWYADRDRDKPASIPDITEAVRLVSEISKGAKRERDSQNANWISRKDLGRLVFEMLEVVRLHVEPDTYLEIRKGFGALAVK